MISIAKLLEGHPRRAERLAKLPPALRMLALGFQQRVANPQASPAGDASDAPSTAHPTPPRDDDAEFAARIERAMARLEARVDALERLAPQTSNPTPMATILARVDTLERRMREMELAR